MSSIFISLASYREPELRQTIESAIENADNPDDLYFGVYSQVEDGEHIDLSGIPNVTEIIVPATEARGAGYARAQVMKMFNDQDYFLQIDAHSVFPKHWDTKTINLYNKIRKDQRQDKVIISFWAKPYMRDPNTNEVILDHDAANLDIVYPHYTQLVRYYDTSWIGGRIPMPAYAQYHESACVLGGFIFADKRIVSEVPYDDEISWTGEEITFSVRAYTRGWKIYSPRPVLLYHNYTRHNNPRIWSDTPRKWKKYEEAGRKKVYEVFTFSIQGPYGLGDEKLYEEYQNRFALPNEINLRRESARWLRRMS